MHHNKLTMANKCTSFAGRFGGLSDLPLQYPAHRPMEEKHSHCIASAAARVIGFGTHNQGCGGENGTSEASSKRHKTNPLLMSSMPHAS